MVCASISCSLMGLPLAVTLVRRRLRMLMKSLALMTPMMVQPSESHRGADAMPCGGAHQQRARHTPRATHQPDNPSPPCCFQGSDRARR